jgi:DNA polymerase-2
VDGLYFTRQRDLSQAREICDATGLALCESDLKPADRFLMERHVTLGLEAVGRPRRREGWLELRDPPVRGVRLRCPVVRASSDVETDGLDGRLYSIAVSGAGDDRVFLVGETRPVDACVVEWCADERALLRAFLEWVARRDPDILVGWNVVGFDLDVLERRCRAQGLSFSLGRAGERAAVLGSGVAGRGNPVARVPGRVVLDGIDLLRASFRQFERYDLETVAQALLGRGKDIAPARDRVAEIRRMFREDPVALAAYNLEDCRLADAIFDAADLVSFAIRRAELTGLALDRVGGSVAAFDNLYLPRLHRRGRVAPDVGSAPAAASPGGYVMDSRPGLYRDVLLLDFKSLYPSIIRTFGVDPLGLAEPGEDPVPGFAGARFAREGAILPEIIEGLWAERDRAKAERDGALSQAVKIIMNSFYGVLGATGCRFHDARLATSITRRGHEIIRQSRTFIEELGHQVIYGDTDSLFVLPGAADPAPAVDAPALGGDLAAALNDWWRERLAREHRLRSYLEVEYETHFVRFLMPTVRGEETGSKKRYAGLVNGPHGPELVFRGLESVRTDWTPLARRVQRELYRRIFLDEPYEDFLRQTAADLMAGRLDAELVYRKRIRRPLDSYQRNVPPHVQAARKLPDPGRFIEYVITLDGPEPVRDAIPAPDLAHYRDRQLAPVADGILHFLDTSFAAVAGPQLDFF